MPKTGVGARAVEVVTQISHIPPSFDGNAILYALALTSVMCIACLGISVAGWMVRDIWRDRYCFGPRSLIFMFRSMMGLAGFAAFFRSMPEVVYLQAYGEADVSVHMQAIILTAKRVADSFALWLVLGWMLILVAIYPSICVALRTGPAKSVIINASSTWPRLARPLFIFACVVAVASMFTYAKVYGVR